MEVVDLDPEISIYICLFQLFITVYSIHLAFFLCLQLFLHIDPHLHRLLQVGADGRGRLGARDIPIYICIFHLCSFIYIQSYIYIMITYLSICIWNRTCIISSFEGRREWTRSAVTQTCVCMSLFVRLTRTYFLDRQKAIYLSIYDRTCIVF